MTDVAASEPLDLTATSRIGRTSLHVRRVGLGTAPLGGWPMIVPREQAIATVRRAWELGLRYYDTAPFYGHGLSEQHLGAVLPEMSRDGFAVSTKVGRLLEPGDTSEALFKGVPPLMPRFDFSKDGTRASLVSSLERLGLDTVDIVLIHDPDDHHQEALDGAYEALAQLRAEGAVRAIGAGMNYTEPLTRFIYERDFDCMLAAGRYTLLEQDSLDDLLPAATERHVSIIAGGVFNSGLLIDPGPESTYNYERAPAEIVERAARLRDACATFGVPLRAAAVQFPLFHPAIATIILGARTPEEAEDCVEMLRFPIPRDLWSSLKEKGLIRADAPTPE